MRDLKDIKKDMKFILLAANLTTWFCEDAGHWEYKVTAEYDKDYGVIICLDYMYISFDYLTREIIIMHGYKYQEELRVKTHAQFCAAHTRILKTYSKNIQKGFC